MRPYPDLSCRAPAGARRHELPHLRMRVALGIDLPLKHARYLVQLREFLGCRIEAERAGVENGTVLKKSSDADAFPGNCHSLREKDPFPLAF